MTQYNFTATVTSEDNLSSVATQPFTVNSIPHMGATAFSADYQPSNPFGPSRYNAAQEYDSFMSRTMSENWQKTYFSNSEYPGVGGTPIPNDIYTGAGPGSSGGLIDNGCKLWLCYSPPVPYTQTDASNMVASIIAMQNIGWHGKVCIIQEPQDPNKGLSSATYIPAARSYYTYLKGVHGVFALSGRAVTVVYNAASNQGEAAVGSWYPGDAYCDEVAQDMYGETYWGSASGTSSMVATGVTLTTLQNLANNALPSPKVMNHGEFANSLVKPTSSRYPTNAQILAYFEYINGVFLDQINNGYTIGQVMYYNGNNNTDTGVQNIITSGSDFRVPTLQAFYDSLNF